MQSWKVLTIALALIGLGFLGAGTAFADEPATPATATTTTVLADDDWDDWHDDDDWGDRWDD